MVRRVSEDGTGAAGVTGGVSVHGHVTGVYVELGKKRPNDGLYRKRSSFYPPPADSWWAVKEEAFAEAAKRELPRLTGESFRTQGES